MASRDRTASSEFVATHSASLHRAAYLMAGDVGLAQDLVQEALTKTYVAWPRLRDPSRASPSEQTTEWYTCTVPAGSCERADADLELSEDGTAGGFPVVLPDGRVAG